MRNLCTLTLALLLVLTLAACGAPGSGSASAADAASAAAVSDAAAQSEQSSGKQAATAKKTKKKSNEKKTKTPAAPLSQAVSLVETAVKKNFGKNYSMDYDEEAVTFQIWPKGVGDEAYNASLNNAKSLKKWNRRVSALEKKTPHWVKTLEEAGYGGMSVSVSVQNDLNRDNTLLTVKDGKTTYNWVEETLQSAQTAEAQTPAASTDAAPVTTPETATAAAP